MPLKDSTGIIVIIALFLCVHSLFLNFYSEVWWDSSVYIGMGKYIFSFGNSGLWEESRPLVFPLLLGTGQILNLNVIYFGRFISIIFAVLVILITYRIGLKIFSKKVALLSSFFLAFSYNFIFFSPNILTEIPSTFFVLLAFYSFLNERYPIMGLFVGIAIMTRFFQIFALLGLGLVLFIYMYRKQNFIKKILHLIVIASIPILPYMLLNHYLYDDIFLPLKVQAHLNKTTGWTHYEEFWFYFSGLLKENFFIVFLFSLPLFFKKNYKFSALVFIPLIYIIIFSFIKHKEMRFMLVILPFLYLLTSYCLEQIYSKIYYKKFALGLFFVIGVVWLSITFTAFKNIISYKYQRADEGLLYFQNYLKDDNGIIWVTNPLYALYSNSKIDGLLYYYSSENLIKFINENKDKPDTILFNNCDVACPPSELDPLCLESREILNRLLHKFNKVYQKEINQCEYGIYRRPVLASQK